MSTMIRIRNVPETLHRTLKGRAPLAEALDTPPVARDRRLASAGGHGAEIEII